VKSLLVLLFIGLLNPSLSLDDSSAATFRIKAGNSALPDGTVVELSIGGEGCHCEVKPVKGKIDSRGYVTVTLISSCETVDTTRCRALAMATLTDGKTTIVYKGNSKLTQTTSGTYISTIIVVP
jgi:hypothetical protein